MPRFIADQRAPRTQQEYMQRQEEERQRNAAWQLRLKQDELERQGRNDDILNELRKQERLKIINENQKLLAETQRKNEVLRDAITLRAHLAGLNPRHPEYLTHLHAAVSAAPLALDEPDIKARIDADKAENLKMHKEADDSARMTGVDPYQYRRPDGLIDYTAYGAAVEQKRQERVAAARAATPMAPGATVTIAPTGQVTTTGKARPSRVEVINDALSKNLISDADVAPLLRSDDSAVDQFIASRKGKKVVKQEAAADSRNQLRVTASQIKALTDAARAMMTPDQQKLLQPHLEKLSEIQAGLATPAEATPPPQSAADNFGLGEGPALVPVLPTQPVPPATPDDTQSASPLQ